jgi:hypothetical protein
LLRVFQTPLRALNLAHVSSAEKGNEHVRVGPMLQLMIDGPDSQLAIGNVRRAVEPPSAWGCLPERKTSRVCQLHLAHFDTFIVSVRAMPCCVLPLNVHQGFEVSPSTGGEGARSDLKRSAQGPTATLNPLIHDGRQPPFHQDAE